MFGNDNTEIIMSEGVQVTIDNGPPTFAVIGRISRNSTDAISVEHQRRGVFLLDSGIKNGAIVTNTLTGEKFIDVSVYPMVYNDRIVAYTSLLFICNMHAMVIGYDVLVDYHGNRTPVERDPLDVEGYALVITDKLKQYDPGIMPNALYKLFIPVIPLDYKDRFIINGRNYKVVAIDNLSFDGLLVVQIGTDVVGTDVDG